MIKSIITKKAEVRNSEINGIGTFAKERIYKGEMVFIKGGHILTKETMFSINKIDGYWPISDEYVIAAKREEEFKDVKVYVNHSCNPNCGIHGEITCVAMRDIDVGEELTMDYAMIDNEENSFICHCGANNCRHIVTGFDWKIKELQDRYGNFFAQYLLDKIYNEDK